MAALGFRFHFIVDNIYLMVEYILFILQIMNNVMSLLTFNGIFKWSDTYIEKENQVFLAGDILKTIRYYKLFTYHY